MTELNLERLIEQMDALQELGRPAQALKLAHEGLSAAPDDVRLLLRGAAYAGQLEDYPHAIALATRAVASAPQMGFPLALLAQFQRLNGDSQTAQITARQALAVDPEETLAHYEVGLGEAVQADTASFLTRKRHIQRARDAAEQLEHLSPESPDGPALHAMLSAIERHWPRHEAELARALARDPQDTFTHNVRLMGLQYRRSGTLIDDLLGRLREEPDNEYAREALREQFGFKGWLQQWSAFRPLILVILSLPLYGLWRLGRIRRHRAAYQAAFTVGERRRDTLKHLPLLALSLIMVLLVLEQSFPLAFTTPSLIYGPLWFGLGLCVLAITVPAMFSGQGGFYGRAEGQPIRALPAPRPLTFRRLIGPIFLGSLTLLVFLFLVGLLYFTVTDPASFDLNSVLGLLVLLAFATGMTLITVRAVQRARYGELPAGRTSPNDMLLTLVTLGLMGFALESMWTGWQARNERTGTVTLAGQPLQYWRYEPDSALDNAVSGHRKSCALPEGARYAAVAVPEQYSAPLTLLGAAATVPEDTAQSACLRGIAVQSGSRLRAFPWAGTPLEVRTSLK